MNSFAVYFIADVRVLEVHGRSIIFGSSLVLFVSLYDSHVAISTLCLVWVISPTA